MLQEENRKYECEWGTLAGAQDTRAAGFLLCQLLVPLYPTLFYEVKISHSGGKSI